MCVHDAKAVLPGFLLFHNSQISRRSFAGWNLSRRGVLFWLRDRIDEFRDEFRKEQI